MNILRQFKGAGIIIHGGTETEIRVGRNLDAGHHRFYVAAVV